MAEEGKSGGGDTWGITETARFLSVPGLVLLFLSAVAFAAFWKGVDATSSAYVDRILNWWSYAAIGWVVWTAIVAIGGEFAPYVREVFQPLSDTGRRFQVRFFAWLAVAVGGVAFVVAGPGGLALELVTLVVVGAASFTAGRYLEQMLITAAKKEDEGVEVDLG